MKPRILFNDLQALVALQRAQLDQALARVLDSGWFLLGQELAHFEQVFAAYCQSQHAVGVANGLDALRLSLQALGIGPGDEVLVPSNTYIATWLAVSQVGATPVPVEPDLATYTMDVHQARRLITPRSRALMPVHLYGHPADLDPLLSLAEQHGLAVVEDAAQCAGARYKNRRIGSHGHAVAWSFYPSKNLGALADGGAITTNDAQLAERLRVLRNYGQRERYICAEQGWNSRLEELQAAVLSVRLPALDIWNATRARQAALYAQAFAGCKGLVLPQVAPWAEPVWHLYVVRHPRREALRQALAEAGIQTLVHYPVPPHCQAAYAHLGIPAGSLPVAEMIHQQVFSLPIGPHLQDTDILHVASVLIAAL